MHFQHRSREILGLYNRNRIRTGVQLDFSGLSPRDGGCPATRPDVSWMRCASVAAAAAPADCLRSVQLVQQCCGFDVSELDCQTELVS